ncbi:NADP-dependent malic enzyme-like [Nicotiana sylvestris]|uniref:NADP-dependent malic enzyme-like n=1 Tax=Nicotiana sylvestris TaxID=4096 RepID=UPI00388C81D5
MEQRRRCGLDDEAAAMVVRAEEDEVRQQQLGCSSLVVDEETLAARSRNEQPAATMVDAPMAEHQQNGGAGEDEAVATGHLPANDMLLAASEALAAQVTEEHFAKGMIYPPFGNIRKISAYIAASTVAAKAYELGVATRISRHADLVTYADESCMYTPNYRSYR